MTKKYTVALCLTSVNMEDVDEDQIGEFETYNEAIAFMDKYAREETPIADVFAAELYLYENGEQIGSILLDSL